MDDLIQEFLVESKENLDRLDSELVKLESDPTSAELLASIFRSIHSIKGACGFLGFNKLQTLAHAGESSAGGIPASVGRTSVLFSAPLTAHATGRPTSPYSSPRTDGYRAPRPADSSSRPDRSWPDRRQRRAAWEIAQTAKRLRRPLHFATVLGPALERSNPAKVDRRHLPPKKQCLFHLHSHGYLRR